MRRHVLTLLGALLVAAIVSATRPPLQSAPGTQPAAAPVDGSRPTLAELSDPDSAASRRYFVYDEHYDATVDPTRLYVDRPLQPGKHRARLTPASALFGSGRPSQPHGAPLAVRAPSGAPVTFYAPDFGTFANGERCITVRAGDDGLAAVTFTYGAMASTYRVVAHSPEAIGWVVFQLEAHADAAGTRKGGQ